MILTDAGIQAMTDLRETISCWLRAAFGLPVMEPVLRPLPGVAPYSYEKFKVGASMIMFAPPADHQVDSSGGLTADEQKARVIALRGLSQAREGDFAAAERTFTEAVMLDPELDLRRLPSFWLLPRQVHEAAIGALLTAGRTRDASALIADLKTRYRPRLLPENRED